MGYKPLLPYEVRNASVPLSPHVDNIVLGQDLAETYTIPTTATYAAISGLGGFWMKVGVEALASSGVGSAFGNKPANDSVDVVSDSAADTTQVVTIYGTRDSLGDTVYTDTATLNGVGAVTFAAYSDWSLILAVEISASCAGTVTLSENSGSATITTITTGNTSKGVVSYTPVAGQQGGLVQLVASGATTKQLGIAGTNASGTTIYDSQALTGTTAVYSNSTFATVTKLFVGDLENTVSVIPTIGAATVPAADETDGFGSFYVASGTQQLVPAGKKVSFCRVASTANTISIACYG